MTILCIIVLKFITCTIIKITTYCKISPTFDVDILFSDRVASAQVFTALLPFGKWFLLFFLTSVNVFLDMFLSNRKFFWAKFANFLLFTFLNLFVKLSRRLTVCRIEYLRGLKFVFECLTLSPLTRSSYLYVFFWQISIWKLDEVVDAASYGVACFKVSHNSQIQLILAGTSQNFCTFPRASVL